MSSDFNLKEVVAMLNAMDLHLHRDDKGRFWTIPNKSKTVVQIVVGQIIQDIKHQGIALRITDKYSSLYTIEDGMEEIRTRIQFMYNKHDQERNRRTLHKDAPSP